jgi:hypothetical protein
MSVPREHQRALLLRLARQAMIERGVLGIWLAYVMTRTE